MRNQTKFFRSTTLIFVLLSILSAVPVYADYQLKKSIVNAAGNTTSGSTWELHNSVGEPAIGQGRIAAQQGGEK